MKFAPTLICMVLLCTTVASAADSALDIGSRRQLFVDDYVIKQMNGVRQILHRPTRREIVIQPEHPWEKFGVSYMVTFKDGDKFRAWYRCDTNARWKRSLTAYAESDDGIHWTKPNLGLIEFNGSKENNLVWDGATSNTAVFKDGREGVPADEQYKAVLVGPYKDAVALFAILSPDGLRWRLIPEPILSKGKFDSHNIAFWDDQNKEYVAYTRGVRKEGETGPGTSRDFLGGVRWIRRSTSKDFKTWSEPQDIDTGDAKLEQFYTNAIVRYDRAPDLFFSFPSRFVDLRSPEPNWRWGSGVNDIAFLSSRDGLHFDRTFMEAFVRPGLDQGNWHERSLYFERGIIQTSPTEMSMFAMENWRLPSVHIRRLTLRPDGFVSIQASYQGGELLTKALICSAKELRLNYSTSAVGSIRVEIQTEDGNQILGFTLEDSVEIYGDKIDGPVQWKSGADLSALSGQSIRLRFVMRDADLFAFRIISE